jgi:serine/threonine protein kinase
MLCRADVGAMTFHRPSTLVQPDSRGRPGYRQPDPRCAARLYYLPMPLGRGQVFAGYTIVRLLGSGGMGEVYLAQHPRLPRKDALKVLAAEVSANAEYRARFNREADLVSELYHPHIVGIHDRGDHDSQLWISMDYVDGLDTATLVAEKFRNGMPAHQVTKIIAAVASALDYAHDRGLTHRDVKPANIMLTNDEAEQRILLADFGIAHSLKAANSLTATGYTVGTVAYAAPEQLLGQEIDGRTDQYALAATAYHLLTGSQLFPHALVERPIEHAAINSVLATALAKTLDDRFPRCTDFSRALTLAQVEGMAGLNSGQPGQATTQAKTRWKASTGTARMTSQPPIAPPEESSWTVDVTDVGSPRSRWLAMLAVAVVLLLAAAVLIMRPWQQQERSVDRNASSPTSVAPAITFDGMRDFVERYYADLPARPDDAWAKLDAHCQKQTGLQHYLDFWATIQSVTVISVSPRDDTSVVAQLRYVRRDGQTDTEDRWFKMALVNGAMLLDESDRSNLASTTVTTPPAPSPYTSLVGKWSGHHRGLTVSPDGTIELAIPDDPACPACSAAQMPFATIHIGLTSYDGKADGTPNGSGKFFGYVKDTSDTRVIPVGVPVEVDMTNASDYSYLGGPPGYTAAGRVLTVSINGDHSVANELGDQVPFCDAAAAQKSVCGA